MDKDKKKKRGKTRRLRLKRSSGLGGLRGGAPRWMPPQNPFRRTYEKAEQKQPPKEERSHWNGKVETWTEPQKPKQEKVIKYEVDTDELLKELAIENKKTMDEIAARLRGEPSLEESDRAASQELDIPESAESTTEENPAPVEADPPEITEQVDPQELAIEAQDKLDDPLFTDPKFWDRLESELSKELENIEPQEELTEEIEAVEETY